MKDKGIIIKLIQLIAIILIYYISGNKSIFLYASTLSLYNVFISCFSHITLKETYKKINYNYSKFKILKLTSINIIIPYLLFILLSIFISDAINIFLKIENTFIPYLMMSLSIITEPILKICCEYLESYKKNKFSSNLLNVYYILETIILLIISIITLRFTKLPMHISLSLLYLSKIISFLTIIHLMYLKIKKLNIDFNKLREEKQINYKNNLKEILTNNNHLSIISLIKNSYYYISLIILYVILSTKYSYNIAIIEKDLTFLYLYGIYILNFIVDIVQHLTKDTNKKDNSINYIYISFKNILTIAIIFGITSPLISKILFNDNSNWIYLSLILCLSIFVTLYNVTFEYIKSKKIIYISLISGIICKLILTIPLINSFYRMGYNLIYGDVISTIIGMFISIVINYICIKLNNKKERALEKILVTLYESILLCIILVLLQFVIPIKTDNYIKAILILMIYLSISIIFIKLKKKKRG